jgi:hypothetical protein
MGFLAFVVVLFCFETGSLYESQAGPGIFDPHMPLTPQCRDFRPAPPMPDSEWDLKFGVALSFCVCLLCLSLLINDVFGLCVYVCVCVSFPHSINFLV